MAASVEDLARSSMENLIEELHKEREVSNKERTLRAELITKVTEYETQKQESENEMKDLHNQVSLMESRIQTLMDTINMYEQNKDRNKAEDTTQSDEQGKDTDKADDTDIKEEEGASEVALAKKGIEAVTMDSDDSKSGGTDAAAITITDSVSEDSELMVAKVEPTEDKKESESSGPEWNKVPMNESRRFLIQVRMILRFTFRGYFGVSFSNRWGYWWDRYMSTQVWKYGDWLDYPDGHRVLKGHSNAVWAAAVSTDGRFLFTAGESGSLIVWDLLNNSMLKQFDVSDQFIMHLIYERDLIISAGDDKKIRILNGISHKLIRTLEGHTYAVWSVQFNEKYTQIVSASVDQSVKIWCVKSGNCLATLTGHTHCINSAYFMDNDTRVISASKDNSIKVWSVPDKSECDTITDGVKGNICDMCVNCDSSLVACCFNSDGFTIYNWPNMDIVRSMDVYAWKGQFHPSNPDILAVSEGGPKSIKIYNVRSGDSIAEWTGHTDQTNRVCWSRDGYRLVSVSRDRAVRVWDCAA